MKNLILLTVALFLFGFLSAQQFSVPQVTPEQKTEILYNHLIAYCATGITFAKTKGISAREYGEYIGQQFKPFWNPDDGFPVIANGLMFILAGMHPDNEMQIVEQSEKMVRFKMKNVDLSFKMGPAFGITYNEFIDCSEGILSVLAEHMNTKFSHKTTDEIWYEVTLKAK